MNERPHNGSIREWIGGRPWLFVWVAFGILIGAWSVLITIALKNRPQSIPLPAHPSTTVDTGGDAAHDVEGQDERREGGGRDGD